MPNDKIKLTGPSMEQRVADRLRNSGFGANPDQTTVHGTGPPEPTQTYSTVAMSAITAPKIRKETSDE